MEFNWISVKDGKPKPWCDGQCTGRYLVVANQVVDYLNQWVINRPGWVTPGPNDTVVENRFVSAAEYDYESDEWHLTDCVDKKAKFDDKREGAFSDGKINNCKIWITEYARYPRRPEKPLDMSKEWISVKEQKFPKEDGIYHCIGYYKDSPSVPEEFWFSFLRDNITSKNYWDKSNDFVITHWADKKGE